MHYDFGDDWMFTILVQKKETEPRKSPPKLIKSVGEVEQYPDWEEFDIEDFFVEIPDVKGKITTKKKGSSIYVNYEIGRDYDPEKKYNVPRRVTIGKVAGADRKMDDYGCSFVIMVKGMASLVNSVVLEHKGEFEEERKYSIRKHHVYGMTVKEKLYADDEKERYFHIYHSTGKEHGEKEQLEEMLERLGKALEAQYGTDYQLSDADSKYFEAFYDSKGILTLVREKADVIKQELKLCGYFCIVTSEKMTAKEAIDL